VHAGVDDRQMPTAEVRHDEIGPEEGEIGGVAEQMWASGSEATTPTAVLSGSMRSTWLGW
jgi:hypothetical protein